MGEIEMFYELRKLYGTSSAKNIIIISIFLSFFIPIYFIHNYETYDYSTGKEAIVSGLDGLIFEKEQIDKVEGPLTTKCLNEALTIYQENDTEEESYYAVENAYPQFLRIIIEAYKSKLYSSGFDVRKILNANDYYEQMVARIDEKIKIFGEDNLYNWEKDKMIERADQIEKPFIMGYTDQWIILLKSFYLVYFFLCIVVIFISTSIFSFEKEQNMDLILGSITKPKLYLLCRKKIVFNICYITFIFLVDTIIMSAIVLGAVGISGWNSSIQIMPQFFTILYDWNVLQLITSYLFSAWISLITIGLISQAIDVIVKNRMSSLILVSSCIILPFIIKNSIWLPIFIRRILMIQPIFGIDIFSLLNSVYIYSIVDIDMSPYWVNILSNIGICMISVIIIPKIFRKSEINI